MTIQVSTAVDVSLEHSSTASEMVEVPVLRMNSLNLEEECEPLSNSNVVEVEQLLELLEEELLEENEDAEESTNNNIFSDSDNSSAPDQSKLIRRDSDTSDVSSSDGNESSQNNNSNDNTVSPEVAERIIAQVETMFSDDHLLKDGFLLKHVRRRSDGFVSLKLVAGLRKVKQISREFPIVMTSLRKSSKLEVNSEGTKIRRMDPLTPLLKSLPTTGQKENARKDSVPNMKEKEIAAPANNANVKDCSEDQQVNLVNRNAIARNNRNQNRQNSRKISSASTGSSNGGSRHGSFSSGHPHPAELFRNVMSCTSSSGSGEDSPQAPRRRGGSLPINTAGNIRPSAYNTSTSPNNSPPNAYLRPKSNSYCEGQNINGTATTTMSPWLLKRKEAQSRNSEGNIVLPGVIRQPRGPDGTKGFATGYRTLILQERRESLSNSQTTLSA